MNRRTAPLTVVACLAVLTCAHGLSSAQDWSLKNRVTRRCMWEGFRVGSAIHHSTTTDVKIRGKPDRTRKIRKETKFTLSKITKTEVLVKAEKLVDGKWVASEEKHARPSELLDSKPTIKEDGTGTVTIQGKDYPCGKSAVSDVSGLIGDPMQAPKPEATAPKSPGIVWEHKTLGILKIEMRRTVKGERDLTTLVVTKLGATHKLGGVELKCRELTWSSSRLGGKTVRLESAAVPGWTVLTRGTVEQGPISMTHVRELVGLTTKPPSRGAPK